MPQSNWHHFNVLQLTYLIFSGHIACTEEKEGITAPTIWAQTSVSALFPQGFLLLLPFIFQITGIPQVVLDAIPVSIAALIALDMYLFS